jgi:hypothetical protein
MALWRKSDCAYCKKRLCQTKNRIKYRRLAQSSPWITDSLINKGKWAGNKHVCYKCYCLLLKRESSSSDIEPFLETTPVMEQIETVVEVNESRCDFSFDQLSDRRCYVLTGIYPHQLDELAFQFAGVVPKVNHSIRNCIGFYLMKLRLGISLEQLGSLYNNLSVHQAKDLINFVRELLRDEFVPLNLGVSAISRDDIKQNHTTTMSKVLLAARDDAVITIWDATYVYIEKSSDYSLQKSVYSGHKHRPLVKFMILAASDGHMIDVFGPFKCDGKNNDASITKHVIENKMNEIDTFFQEHDLFVVDRGFRDSVEFLEERNFEVQLMILDI